MPGRARGALALCGRLDRDKGARFSLPRVRCVRLGWRAPGVWRAKGLPTDADDPHGRLLSRNGTLSPLADMRSQPACRVVRSSKGPGFTLSIAEPLMFSRQIGRTTA